jgi:GMP synthase (glutamine-hydrolysing)
MYVRKRIEQNLGLDPERTILAQGTLRPDLIESGSRLASGKADVIKTHHNDTELVRQLRAEGRVLEPLKDLHKDEVRALGEMLGLPAELVWRQPFPGPGLAIRIICAKDAFIENYDEVATQLAEFGDDKTTVNLLPIKTVGVQGDGRSYSYAAVLSGEENWSKLFDLAREIPKKVKGANGVNRVVFAFGEPIESGDKEAITPTLLTSDVIEQERRADHIVNEILREYGLNRSLSQVPVILTPVSFGEAGKRSVAIRPFITNDFMTGRPAVPGQDMPEEALHEIVKSLLADQDLNLARVMLDLTSKPPGTTEWE